MSGRKGLRAALAHYALTVESTTEEYEKVAYSYAEEVAYVTILWSALVAAITWFFLRYANRSLFKWHTWINCFMGYFTALGLLLLIPLDVAVTKLMRQASSPHGLQMLSDYSNSIYSLYNALFWPTQIFANILLFFFEEYNESGYFTVWQRVKDATYQIVLFLGLGIIAGVIFLAILLAGGYAGDQDALLVTFVALNNTYGLVVIVFLLGYGLVELPKQMWMGLMRFFAILIVIQDGNLQAKLRRMQGKIALEWRHLTDASCDTAEVVAHALKTKAEVEKLKSPELDACMAKVLKLCPEDFRSSAGGVVQKDKKGHITRHVLAALRKDIKLKVAKYNMCQGRVERLKRLVFHLEDIVAAKHRSDKVTRIKHLSGRESSVTTFLLECYIKPISQRVLSLLVIGMCLSVMLAEVGLMAGESSSVAVLAKAAHDPSINPGGLIVLNLLYLGFISYVMLFALSQLRVADLMEIVPEQRTTPRSMSFNARLCCRLAPPLAYNFLTLCFESGVETGAWMNSKLTGDPINSAFSRFYGSMDIIPFLGKNFNLVFPLFTIFLALLQGLNVFNRLLRYFRLGMLQFGDAPVDKKDLEEGMRKLAKYRETMRLQMAREERLRQLNIPNKTARVTAMTTADDDDDHAQTTTADEAASETGTHNTWALSGPPLTREGFMEKKSGREKTGGGWQNRYFVIRSPGVLYQYKKADMSGPPLQTLDLARVLSVALHTTKEGEVEPTRLNVDTPEGTLKLRCRSEEVAIDWKRSLSEWKSYAVFQRMSNGPAMAAANSNSISNADASSLREGSRSVTPPLPGAMTPPVTSMGAGLLASVITKASGVFRSSTPSNDDVGVGVVPGTVSRGSKKGPVLPKPLGGKLQVGNGLFGAFSEKNFVIKSSDPMLKYYTAGETGGPPAGSLDLRKVDKVEFEERNGKRDPLKFVIMVEGKEALKLRTETTQEAERWINGLYDWSNYHKALSASNS